MICTVLTSNTKLSWLDVYYSINLSFCADSVTPTCADGDARLYSNYTSSTREDDELVTQVTGVLEICYNGTYRGVCSGDYNQQEVAETVCYSLGYFGS